MRGPPVLIFILMTSICTPASAQDGKPVVAVFEIENRGSPLADSQLATLTDYLATKLGEGGAFQIIPRSQIRERLQEQKKESYRECYDQSCQIDIGRELAAGLTVSASVGAMGKVCLVSAALYDLKKAATVRTATAKGPCVVEELVLAIEQVAAKLQAQDASPDDQAAPQSKPIFQPGPAPMPAGPATPAKPVLGDLFSEVRLDAGAIMPISGISGGSVQPLIGPDLLVDIRAGDWLTVGAAIQYVGFELFQVGLRAGLLQPIGGSSWWHTWLLAGGTFSTTEAIDFSDDADENWEPAIGFHAAIGTGLKWMFGPKIGLSLDLILGYAYIESTETDHSGSVLVVKLNPGFVFNW